VVRNLQTGAVRVVGRRSVIDVQLAGDFLAFRPDVRGDEAGATVINLREGRVAYRARPAEWYSLGADGKLAVGRSGSAARPSAGSAGTRPSSRASTGFRTACQSSPPHR
jgi:hypothetical protein